MEGNNFDFADFIPYLDDSSDFSANLIYGLLALAIESASSIVFGKLRVIKSFDKFTGFLPIIDL